MTEPRKRTARKQPKKPEPKYPNLRAGLQRLGLPDEPSFTDYRTPIYSALLDEFYGAKK